MSFRDVFHVVMLAETLLACACAVHERDERERAEELAVQAIAKADSPSERGAARELAELVSRKPRQSYQATVEKVADGDTVWATVPGKQSDKLRVHLADCPEHDQPFGDQAKRLTEKLCLDKKITVTSYGKSYDRVVADVTVGDKDLAHELVRHGLAWVDTRYGKPPELLSLQEAAQAAHDGLWADENPIPPWEWRKGRRK